MYSDGKGRYWSVVGERGRVGVGTGDWLVLWL